MFGELLEHLINDLGMLVHASPSPVERLLEEFLKFKTYQILTLIVAKTFGTLIPNVANMYYFELC